jgi:hypothetical protein
VFAKYEVNWRDIDLRYQESGEQYPIEWRLIIDNGLDTCGEALCGLTSPTALDLYAEYCKEQLQACSFISYPAFENGSVLISYLNILIDESVYTRSETPDIAPFDLVSGNEMLIKMARVFNII